jgi:hypothetical protein
MQLYQARNPKKSPLWQCVHHHFDQFLDPHLGALRPIIPEVIAYDTPVGCAPMRPQITAFSMPSTLRSSSVQHKPQRLSQSRAKNATNACHPPTAV